MQTRPRYRNIEPGFDPTNTLKLQIEYRPLDGLKTPAATLRRYQKRHQEHLLQALRKYGFILPIAVGADDQVLHGSQLLLAAKELGYQEVPTVRLSHLSKEDVRVLRIALHKLEELSSWDEDVLKAELQFLITYDVDLVTHTAFSSAEIDTVLYAPSEERLDDPDDALPEPGKHAVSRRGDIWEFAGGHRLACMDALEAASYEALLQSELAGLIICDPPYNVRVRGNVSSRKDAREFAMASGEMSRSEFEAFLRTSFELTSQCARDGALSFQFIDWRHAGEMRAAGEAVYSNLLNVCVWAKTNGGQGSFYRSAHEFCFVWKIGEAPHLNNIELGRNGRNRTNVWSYPGANVPRSKRQRQDENHVTPKNVAMVQDAILDASRRGDIVLDAFAGSGTTLVAAHRAKRRGFGLEIDPLYADLIVRRMERITAAPARLVGNSRTFCELAAERLSLPCRIRSR
ncbi:MAG: DNA methylase N-4 [Beijerinckiaceae bacterium]|nr:MAG: DNA methylase N-4 [Beijerinckiaceae bacterium]